MGEGDVRQKLKSFFSSYVGLLTIFICLLLAVVYGLGLLFIGEKPFQQIAVRLLPAVFTDSYHESTIFPVSEGSPYQIHVKFQYKGRDYNETRVIRCYEEYSDQQFVSRTNWTSHLDAVVVKLHDGAGLFVFPSACHPRRGLAPPRVEADRFGLFFADNLENPTYLIQYPSPEIYGIVVSVSSTVSDAPLFDVQVNYDTGFDETYKYSSKENQQFLKQVRWVWNSKFSMSGDGSMRRAEDYSALMSKASAHLYFRSQFEKSSEIVDFLSEVNESVVIPPELIKRAKKKGDLKSNPNQQEVENFLARHGHSSQKLNLMRKDVVVPLTMGSENQWTLDLNRIGTNIYYIRKIARDKDIHQVLAGDNIVLSNKIKLTFNHDTYGATYVYMPEFDALISVRKPHHDGRRK
ncbi:hypothetical protein GUA87_08985 [Sneathiella sp. P13V-1]|uniref:hypothetical protein n=1 Tax=Sneathiella sp. P13V-1 TaxID=2697366 RepID=UPI00187B28B4|nr:hypothetical protein [Sneathiella sp. P13V-1]MBE7636976.1 hypothetical protein [Sneathiella sp. P13V-1]